MPFKKILLGLLLCSSLALSLTTHTDGKPIYEPIDVTVTPINVIVNPIDVVVEPMDITIYYPLPDGDNDGVNNDVDNCKYLANANQLNFDNDAFGDVCDDDDDNDGFSDVNETASGTNPQDKDDYPGKVNNEDPIVNAGDDKTVTVNQAITLTGTATDSDGTIVSYEWKEGSTVLATTASVDYTPTVEGSHILVLTVTDDDGAMGSDSVVIVTTISNQLPVANAGDDKTVIRNNTITIVGTGADSDGIIASYIWKEGGTTLATTASFTYTPTTVGTHTLTLMVTDNDGATSVEDTIVINVTESLVSDGTVSISTKGSSYFIGSMNIESSALDIVLSQDNTKAYIASNSGKLNIVDISNLSEPILLGEYTSNSGINIVVLSKDGTKAYMGDGAWLKVLNITDSSSPVLLASYRTGSTIYGLDLSSDETKIYIANSSVGLTIVDISDLSELKQLGNYNTPGYAMDVTISSDSTKAYVADHESGLQIIDIKDSSNLSLLANYHTTGTTYRVTLSSDGTKAYVANLQNGLEIIDIRNLSALNLLGSYNTKSYNFDVKLSKDEKQAYIIDKESGLEIIDISNPILPTLLKSYNTHGHARSVVISEDESKAYVVDTDSFNIIDISNPPTPIFSGNYEHNYNRYSKVITSKDGSRTYVSRDNVIDVIDTSNSFHPTLLWSSNPNITNYSSINDMILSEDETKIYLSSTGRVSIVDLSDSSKATLLGFYNHESNGNAYLTNIVLSKDHTKAYIADYNLGIKIFEISDPLNISLLGSYKTSSKALSIAISPDSTKAYIAEGNAGVEILDISNPSNPTFLSNYIHREGFSYSQHLAISNDGKNIYIADVGEGLHIVDVSNASNPLLLGTFDTEFSPYSISLSKDNQKAYITSSGVGLLVLDVNNSSTPTIFSSYETNGDMRGRNIILSEDNTKAYIIDNGELEIIDLSIDTLFKVQNFGEANIELIISSKNQQVLKMEVTTNRDDIITIGSYDSELTYSEYNNKIVNIPISYIDGKIGQTILTITLKYDNKTVVRTIYFNVFSYENLSDTDNDRISDTRETELGLNPNSNDSDGDGILDSVEIGDVNNPADTDGDGTIDALDLDSDNDGFSDKEEVEAGTSPTDDGDFPDTTTDSDYLIKLQRTGWNLVSVCQDMSADEIDMSNIEEIQSQDGNSIYTGEWASFSNLEVLKAGYGYWIKSTQGNKFNVGSSKGKLSVLLKRDGWNLVASCEERTKEQINMSHYEEIQNQDGEAIYTGEWKESSNLDRLLNGYGYWVKSSKSIIWIAKEGLSIPNDFTYQVINNLGENVDQEYDGYTIRLYSTQEHDINGQATHVSIMVNLNGVNSSAMPIQSTYDSHSIVVGVYDANNELVGVSEITTVNGNTTIIVETNDYYNVDKELENIKNILEDDSISYTTEAEYNQSEYASFHLDEDEVNSLQIVHALVAIAIDPDEEWFLTKADKLVHLAKAGEDYEVKLQKENQNGIQYAPVDNSKLRLVVRIQHDKNTFEYISQNEIEQYAEWIDEGILAIHVPENLEQGRLLVGVRPNLEDEQSNAIAERWSTVVIAEVWKVKSEVKEIDSSSVIFPIDNNATKGFATGSQFTAEDLSRKIKEELNLNNRLFLPIVVKDINLEEGDLVSYIFREKPYSGRVFKIETRNGQQFALLTLDFFSVYEITDADNGFMIKEGLYPKHVVYREGEPLVDANVSESEAVSKMEKSNFSYFFDTECTVGKIGFTFEPKLNFAPFDLDMSYSVYAASDKMQCKIIAKAGKIKRSNLFLFAGGPLTIIMKFFGGGIDIKPYGEASCIATALGLGITGGVSTKKGGYYKMHSPINYFAAGSLNLNDFESELEAKVAGDFGMEVELNVFSDDGYLDNILKWLNDIDDVEDIGFKARAGFKLEWAVKAYNAPKVNNSQKSSESAIGLRAEGWVIPTDTLQKWLEDMKAESLLKVSFKMNLLPPYKSEAKFTFDSVTDNGEGKASVNGLKNLLGTFSEGVLTKKGSSIFNQNINSIVYSMQECEENNYEITSSVIGCSGWMCGKVTGEVKLCKSKLDISTESSLSGTEDESGSENGILKVKNLGTDEAQYSLEWSSNSNPIRNYVSFSPTSGTLGSKGINSINATFSCPSEPGNWTGTVAVRRIGGEIEDSTSIDLTCKKKEDDCCGHLCAEGETPPPCGCPSATRLPPLCCTADSSASCSEHSGDPHFITFDGLSYDFQGVGEFILLKSLITNDTFEVQTRYRPWGNRTDVSVAQAIAMKIDDEIITFYRGIDSPLRINGNPKNLVSGESVTLPTGGKIIHVGSVYRIIAKDGSSIDIRNTSSDMRISIRIPTFKNGQIVGLFGNSDQDSQNDITMRDGTSLGTNPSFDTLYPSYADSWRIIQDESLFDYAEGETTETFTNKLFPRIYTSTANLNENIRTNSEEVCRTAGITSTVALNNCILDVSLTGDKGFADTPTVLTTPIVNLEVIPPEPKTVNDSGFGQFKGLVVDAVTNQTLNSGKVTLTVDGNPLAGNYTLPISDGKYETAVVPTGTGYQLTVEVDGYFTEHIFGLNAPDREQYEIETIHLIPNTNDGTGLVSGQIRNALNNNHISSLNVHIRSHSNNRFGNILQSTVTDEDGNFLFSNLEIGNYTLEIEGEGYVTNYITVVSLGENQTSEVELVSSPELGDSQFRIVLSWGETPLDLDSHLTGPDGEDGNFHISYNDSGNENLEVAPYVYLDRDDTDSFGPETITIGALQSGNVYRYSVHDYSNGGSTSSQVLGQSGARVEVYGDGNRLISSFNIPNQAGTLWTVFEITQVGKIIPINNIGYESVSRKLTISQKSRRDSILNKDNKLSPKTDYWHILFQAKKK